MEDVTLLFTIGAIPYKNHYHALRFAGGKNTLHKIVGFGNSVTRVFQINI